MTLAIDHGSRGDARRVLRSALVLGFAIGLGSAGCADATPTEQTRGATEHLVGTTTCTRDPGAVIDAIYLQVLDRGPDDGGKAYWMKALTGGMTVKAIVQSFVASDEYKQRFIWDGVVNDIYMQVLERAPDASGGLASVAALEHGSTVRTLVASAVGSPEYASRFIAPVSAPAAVSGLYERILAREPESDAVVQAKVQIALTSGWSGIIPAFTGDEYVARFGEWSVPGRGDAAFSAAVNHLYKAVLAREPDSTTVVAWWVASAKANGWDVVSSAFFASEYDQLFGLSTVPGEGQKTTWCP